MALKRYRGSQTELVHKKRTGRPIRLKAELEENRAMYQ